MTQASPMALVQLTVYRTVGEAHLAAGFLTEAGLHVDLRHEQVAHLAGELPSHETWVELWIPAAELEEARALLAEAAERAEASHLNVPCPACREDNPGSFEVCWACGTHLPEQRRPRLRAV